MPLPSSIRALLLLATRFSIWLSSLWGTIGSQCNRLLQSNESAPVLMFDQLECARLTESHIYSPVDFHNRPLKFVADVGQTRNLELWLNC